MAGRLLTLRDLSQLSWSALVSQPPQSKRAWLPAAEMHPSHPMDMRQLPCLALPQDVS